MIDKTKDIKSIRIALKDSHTQVMFLASMVNDLATLSRAERGKLNVEIENINVYELIQDLAKNYAKNIQEKNYNCLQKLTKIYLFSIPVVSTYEKYCRILLLTLLNIQIKGRSRLLLKLPTKVFVSKSLIPALALAKATRKRFLTNSSDRKIINSQNKWYWFRALRDYEISTITARRN